MRGKYRRLPKGSGASLGPIRRMQQQTGGIQAFRPDERGIVAKKSKQCKVTCWCERRIMPSTWERVKQGLGETCGAPDCHAPKEGTGA